jgi:peptide/nickel transport system permease protein
VGDAQDFDPVPADGGDEATHEVAGRSPTQLAFERFRKDRASMAAFSVVAFYVLAAISAPILTHFGVLNPLTFHQDLLDANTLPIGRWGGITWQHPLGIEPGTGRDLLSRIWLGISFSMLVALSSSLITMFIGVILGIVAGFSRGWVDAIIGRLIDLTLTFPQLLLILALSSIGLDFVNQVMHVPAGTPTQAVYIISILGLFAWTGLARLVRGQVFSLREREFIDAARVIGAGPFRMYFKEILPNLWAPIIVYATLLLPTYIGFEAALSFLGVGVIPPDVTFGSMLANSVAYFNVVPSYLFIPGSVLVVLVVTFNLLGDALRDALDPKTVS